MTPNISTQTNNTTPTFTFSSTDASGIAHYTCTLDSVTSNCSSPDKVSALKDGSHSFKVTAIDKAGNASMSPPFAWTQVTVLPKVGFLTPPSGYYINIANVSAFKVAGNCSVNGAAVLLSGPVSASVTCASGGWNTTLNLSSAAQGTVTLTANLTDSYGNKATPATQTLTKSTIAPVIGSIGTSPQLFNYIVSNQTPLQNGTVPSGVAAATVYGVYSYQSPSLSLSWTAKATGSSTTTCYLDGQSSTCQSPFSVAQSATATSPIAHSFYVVVKDAAGNTTKSNSLAWTFVSAQVQKTATQTTANASANQCGGIQPFYYEIGNSATTSTTLLASGSTGDASITRSTYNEIASSSKWIFGSYAVQQLATASNQYTVDHSSQYFLHMSSGYDTFVDNSCPATGSDSVFECGGMWCLYNEPKNGENKQVQGTSCFQTKQELLAQYGATYPTSKYQYLSNATFTSQNAGHFSYSGGHFQMFAAGQSPNNLKSSQDPWGTYGFQMGNFTNSDLKTTIFGGFPLIQSNKFNYAFPQLAGGAMASTNDYAAFLQDILQGNLTISKLLGQDSVCTSPDALGVNAGGTCQCPNPEDNAKYGYCTSVYTPITAENMHYSYGHWVEDDYTIPYADGSFNSAGAFGYYPWIDSTKTYYGVVARYSPQNITFSGGSTIGNGYASELCGREIRYSFFTGIAVTAN